MPAVRSRSASSTLRSSCREQTRRKSPLSDGAGKTSTMKMRFKGWSMYPTINPPVFGWEPWREVRLASPRFRRERPPSNHHVSREAGLYSHIHETNGGRGVIGDPDADLRFG